jgi:hypothetical protein
MPKFYFHLRNATGISIDQDGIDLPNAAVARREALISAHEITSEMLVVDALSLNDAVLEVVDQSGETIATVSFLEAAATAILPSDRDAYRHGVSTIGTRH